MELQGKKIEFDLEEFVPLLLSNKQEGFRLIGERFLNAVMEKEFEAFISEYISLNVVLPLIIANNIIKSTSSNRYSIFRYQLFYSCVFDVKLPCFRSLSKFSSNFMFLVFKICCIFHRIYLKKYKKK